MRGINPQAFLLQQYQQQQQQQQPQQQQQHLSLQNYTAAANKYSYQQHQLLSQQQNHPSNSRSTPALPSLPQLKKGAVSNPVSNAVSAQSMASRLQNWAELANLQLMPVPTPMQPVIHISNSIAANSANNSSGNNAFSSPFYTQLNAQQSSQHQQGPRVSPLSTKPILKSSSNIQLTRSTSGGSGSGEGQVTETSYSNVVSQGKPSRNGKFGGHKHSYPIVVDNSPSDLNPVTMGRARSSEQQNHRATKQNPSLNLGLSITSSNGKSPSSTTLSHIKSPPSAPSHPSREENRSFSSSFQPFHRSDSLNSNVSRDSNERSSSKKKKTKKKKPSLQVFSPADLASIQKEGENGAASTRRSMSPSNGQQGSTVSSNVATQQSRSPAHAAAISPSQSISASPRSLFSPSSHLSPSSKQVHLTNSTGVKLNRSNSPSSNAVSGHLSPWAANMTPPADPPQLSTGSAVWGNNNVSHNTNAAHGSRIATFTPLANANNLPLASAVLNLSGNKAQLAPLNNKTTAAAVGMPKSPSALNLNSLSISTTSISFPSSSNSSALPTANSNVASSTVSSIQSSGRERERKGTATKSRSRSRSDSKTKKGKKKKNKRSEGKLGALAAAIASITGSKHNSIDISTSNPLNSHNRNYSDSVNSNSSQQERRATPSKSFNISDNFDEITVNETSNNVNSTDSANKSPLIETKSISNKSHAKAAETFPPAASSNILPVKAEVGKAAIAAAVEKDIKLEEQPPVTVLNDASATSIFLATTAAVEATKVEMMKPSRDSAVRSVSSPSKAMAVPIAVELVMLDEFHDELQIEGLEEFGAEEEITQPERVISSPSKSKSKSGKGLSQSSNNNFRPIDEPIVFKENLESSSSDEEDKAVAKRAAKLKTSASNKQSVEMKSTRSSTDNAAVVPPLQLDCSKQLQDSDSSNSGRSATEHNWALGNKWEDHISAEQVNARLSPRPKHSPKLSSTSSPQTKIPVVAADINTNNFSLTQPLSAALKDSGISTPTATHDIKPFFAPATIHNVANPINSAKPIMATTTSTVTSSLPAPMIKDNATTVPSHLSINTAITPITTSNINNSSKGSKGKNSSSAKNKPIRTSSGLSKAVSPPKANNLTDTASSTASQRRTSAKAAAAARRQSKLRGNSATQRPQQFAAASSNPLSPLQTAPSPPSIDSSPNVLFSPAGSNQARSPTFLGKGAKSPQLGIGFASPTQQARGANISAGMPFVVTSFAMSLQQRQAQAALNSPPLVTGKLQLKAKPARAKFEGNARAIIKADIKKKKGKDTKELPQPKRAAAVEHLIQTENVDMESIDIDDFDMNSNAIMRFEVAEDPQLAMLDPEAQEAEEVSAFNLLKPSAKTTTAQQAQVLSFLHDLSVASEDMVASLPLPPLEVHKLIDDEEEYSSEEEPEVKLPDPKESGEVSTASSADASPRTKKKKKKLYEPSEEAILSYADVLGIELPADADLLWIAKLALQNPLPYPWKACEANGSVYFVNFETKECSFSDPSDEYYYSLYEAEKVKKWKNQLANELSSNIEFKESGRLNLSNRSMDDVAAECLMEIIINDYNIASGYKLFGLDLSHNRISDAGIESIIYALENSGQLYLHSLILSHNYLATAAAQSLARFADENEDIHHIDISNNDGIGNMGLESLADSLATCTNLQSLKLAYISMNDFGLNYLADALRGHSTLYLIDLSGNQLTDAGLGNFGSALMTMPRVVELYYSNTDNQISDNLHNEIQYVLDMNKAAAAERETLQFAFCLAFISNKSSIYRGLSAAAAANNSTPNEPKKLKARGIFLLNHSERDAIAEIFSYL
jgi:hypothetical protein